MFETSRDILNWSLAFGSLIALLALAGVFVYGAKILRQIYKTMRTVEGAFEAVSTLFSSIGEKISNSSTIGKFAVDVLKLVGDVHQVKKEIKKGVKKAKKKTSKSKKK